MFKRAKGYNVSRFSSENKFMSHESLTIEIMTPAPPPPSTG